MQWLMITGERRSGTTLLANFLNAQPNMTVLRDYLLVDRCRHQSDILSLGSELTPAQKRKVLHRFDDYSAEVDHMLSIGSETFDTLFDFYGQVMTALGEAGDVLVGHKATMEHAAMGGLLEHFEQLKVIYVLRDPRDMITSALKKPEEFPGSLFDLCEAWQDAQRAVEAVRAKPNIQDRFYVLRYEDLLLETSETLAKLAAFLNVDTLQIPDALDDYGSTWKGNSSFGELSQVFDPAPVGRWKKGNSRAVRITEILLGPAMAREGYEASPAIPVFFRFRVKIRHFLFCRVRWLIAMNWAFIRNVLNPLLNRLGAV